MNKEVVKFLDSFDKLMLAYAKGGAWSTYDLWTILTALRGPDTQELDHAKAAVTGIIRRSVLPRTRTSEFPMGFVCPEEDSKEYLNIRLRLVEERGYYSTHSHYISHAKHAFVALGLSWHAVNVFPPLEEEKKHVKAKSKKPAKRKPGVQRRRK